MKSKRQFTQRGNTPQITSVPLEQATGDAPAAPANGQQSAVSSIVFQVVSMEKVPAKHTPGAATAKYKELEAALRALPPNQAICLPIPEGKEPAKFASNVLNALRKQLPGTRSRSNKTELFVWLGEPSPARNTHSVKGAA